MEVTCVQNNEQQNISKINIQFWGKTKPWEAWNKVSVAPKQNPRPNP